MEEEKKLTEKQRIFTEEQLKFIEQYKLILNVDGALKKANLYLKRTAEKRFYVYFLIDPRTDVIFYVGKGTGKRVRRHVKVAISGRFDNGPKCERILSILNSGRQVKERIFAETSSEAKAFAIERVLIEDLAEHGLTNIVHGIFTSDQSALIRLEHDHSLLMPKEKWLRSLSAERRKRYERNFRMPAPKIWDFLNDAFLLLIRSLHEQLEFEADEQTNKERTKRNRTKRRRCVREKTEGAQEIQGASRDRTGTREH